MMNIAEAIEKTEKEEFPYDVEYLTEWICDGWAESVASKVSGAEACWDCDVDPVQHHISENERNPAHCFVSYKGKYYDAACHEGTEDWRNLPFFRQRQYLLLE